MPHSPRARLLAPCLLAGLLASHAPHSHAHDAYAAGLPHFHDDHSAPLDVRETTVATRGDVTLHELSFEGASGRVPATLVVPACHPGCAAILWGHWLMPHSPTANRSEFLDEAIALAGTGVVSLLIDAPQVRPGFTPPPHKAPGQAGAELLAEQVIDLRRGLDLLLARPDVDPARVAYVGHSFDARPGVVLDAIDKRFTAFVFMAAPYSNRDYVLTSAAPNVVALRKSVPAAELHASLDTYAWADPGTYAAHLGPAPALFQYALHDDYTPPEFAKRYAAGVSGPKDIRFYDTDHALNTAARKDRLEFLQRHLSLRVMPAAILDAIPPTQ